MFSVINNEIKNHLRVNILNLLKEKNKIVIQSQYKSK